MCRYVKKLVCRFVGRYVGTVSACVQYSIFPHVCRSRYVGIRGVCLYVFCICAYMCIYIYMHMHVCK